MASSTHSRPRWLSLVTGVASAGAALFILLKDDVTSGRWSDSYVLTPVVMGIAIAAGHLVVSAWRDRSWLACAGFALAFTTATLLVVYQSTGKQAENADSVGLQAEDANALRERKLAELKTAQADLDDAKKRADAARGTTCGRVCKDWDAKADTARVLVDKLGMELLAYRQQRKVSPRVEWWATAIHVLTGADRERVKALQDLIIPLMLTSLFELTAIAAFGYGFSPRRRSIVSQVANDSVSTPLLPAPVPVPPTNGGNRTTKMDPQIIDWVERFERKFGRPPQIGEVQAAFPGIGRTTAYRYAKEYRAAAA